MKNKLLLFLACFIISFFVIRAAIGSKPGYITGEGVNLRVKGDLSAKVISTMKQNTALAILAKKGSWYRVRLKDGRRGWVFEQYVAFQQKPVVASQNRFLSAKQVPAVISYAKSFRGTGYTYGGASPKGFDCSGYTMFVFNKFGFQLPHKADLQMKYGDKVVSLKNLKPGDLVFFKTPGSLGVNHVGIFIGNDEFIHSSSGYGIVTISRLDKGYYRKCYRGARRLKN